VSGIALIRAFISSTSTIEVSSTTIGTSQSGFRVVARKAAALGIDFERRCVCLQAGCLFLAWRALPRGRSQQKPPPLC